MNDCPVCVYHAANVSAGTLRGFECWNCGGDLSEHAMEQRASIEPSKVYAVNPETIRREPFF